MINFTSVLDCLSSKSGYLISIVSVLIYSCMHVSAIMQVFMLTSVCLYIFYELRNLAISIDSPLVGILINAWLHTLAAALARSVIMLVIFRGSRRLRIVV